MTKKKMLQPSKGESMENLEFKESQQVRAVKHEAKKELQEQKRFYEMPWFWVCITIIVMCLTKSKKIIICGNGNGSGHTWSNLLGKQEK